MLTLNWKQLWAVLLAPQSMPRNKGWLSNDTDGVSARRFFADGRYSGHDRCVTTTTSTRRKRWALGSSARLHRYQLDWGLVSGFVCGNGLVNSLGTCAECGVGMGCLFFNAHGTGRGETKFVDSGIFIRGLTLLFLGYLPYLNQQR